MLNFSISHCLKVQKVNFVSARHSQTSFLYIESANVYADSVFFRNEFPLLETTVQRIVSYRFGPRRITLIMSMNSQWREKGWRDLCRPSINSLCT